MSRPSRIDTQLAATVTLISELRRRLPTAIAHAQAITADGYGSGGGGAKGKNTISDPTLSAVIARDSNGKRVSAPEAVALLEHNARQVAMHVSDMLTLVDRLMPAPAATPRCSGGAGLDGSMEWGDPTCTNVPDGRPSYRGLCNACYQRERRWSSEPRTAA